MADTSELVTAKQNSRKPAIKLEKVSRNYQMGKILVPALRDVTFEVMAGEFIVFLGPSGSGKTTLLNLIGGLDSPSSGRIMVNDTDITKLSQGQLTNFRRTQIGFIFQFFNLLPTLNAEENIALPLIIDGKNLRQYRERIDLLLELVGLSDRRQHKPDQLSGGEQQRVAIARALVTEPAIVLADEPTGNLDSTTADEIMNLLKELNGEGQTIIMVTHNPEACKHTSRTIMVKDGSCFMN